MNDRERDRLQTAVAQIASGLCLWCPTTRAVVRWHAAGKRWQLIVVHRPKCCATRTLAFRRRADDFLHGVLELYGCPIAQYNEDDLVKHVKVQVVW